MKLMASHRVRLVFRGKLTVFPGKHMPPGIGHVSLIVNREEVP
jgi:hypothetical protein